MDKFVKKKPGVSKIQKKESAVAVDYNSISADELRHELWIEKYRPEKLSDIVGNELNIKLIHNWFKDFKAKKTDTKRALLLGGPPGLGKTSLAHVILKEYGYQVKEYNASDVRSKKLVQANLYQLINISSVDEHQEFNTNYKPIGIIMDEVDGMSSGDKGGMAELIQFINPNRGKRSVKKEDRDLADKRWIPPIICICNNRFDKKILNLKKDCLEIVFHKPSIVDLVKVIDRICEKENFKFKSSSKSLVAKYAQGDYRRLLFLLQNLYLLQKSKQEATGSSTMEVIDDEDVLNQYGLFCQKELELSLYDTIDKLLNKRLDAMETLTIYETDKSLLPMMIHENYINFIADQCAPSVFVQLEEIQDCIDNIIQGDIIDKTMYNNQSWYLQPIHGLNSCYIPSYYINKYNKAHFLKSKFTTALGKFSLHCSNRKNVNSLISVVSGSNSYDVFDIRVLSEIILYKAFVKDAVDHENCVELMKNYNLCVDDLEKLIKVNKLSDNFKGLSSVGRVKTALKKIYGSDEPFYKVKKSLNMSLSSINNTNMLMKSTEEENNVQQKKPKQTKKILPKAKVTSTSPTTPKTATRKTTSKINETPKAKTAVSKVGKKISPKTIKSSTIDLSSSTSSTADSSNDDSSSNAESGESSTDEMIENPKLKQIKPITKKKIPVISKKL